MVMKAEEGKDTSPCQGTPSGETAWDKLCAVTQQLSANHTCAHTGITLSRAHRGHLGTLPATPVLLLTPHILYILVETPQMEQTHRIHV